MAEWSALTRLMRLLVHSDSGATLLDRLHEHLIEQAGGVSSIVVHVDRTSARLRASSASRVEYLPLEPWPAGPGELAAIDRALSLVEVVPVAFAAGSRTSQLLAAPMAFVHKIRLSGREVEARAVIGDVRNRTPVIVDDMLSTGGTVEAAARALRQAGAIDPVTVVATHALLVGDARTTLRRASIAHLIVGNTVAIEDPRDVPLDVVSVAPLIAAAMRRDYQHESLADLRVHR